VWDAEFKNFCAVIQKENTREIGEASNIKDCILYNMKHLKVEIQ